MFINECKICKYSGRKFWNYHNIHAMVIPCPVVWFRVILQALLLSLSLAPDHIRRAMIHRPGPPLPVREIWLRARRALGLWSYGWTSSVDTRTISCTIHGYQFIVNPAPAHIYRLYLFSVIALLEISDFTVCTFKHLQWLTVWLDEKYWRQLSLVLVSFGMLLDENRPMDYSTNGSGESMNRRTSPTETAGGGHRGLDLSNSVLERVCQKIMRQKLNLKYKIN